MRKLAAVGSRFHGSVNLTRSSGIRTVSVIVPTNPLDHSFISGRSKGNKKDSLLILSLPVLSLQAYEEQCSRDYGVNRRKALLANCLAFFYDSWSETTFAFSIGDHYNVLFISY